MRNRNNRGNNDAKKNCPVCGVSVKSMNLNDHLNRVHPRTSLDELNDEKFGNERPAHSQMSRAERRKELEREESKKQLTIAMVIIIILVSAIFGGYLLSTNWGDKNGNDDDSPGPVKKIGATSDKEVKVPLSEVNDGSAHFYSYDSSGVEIRYFILKSSDGVIRSAFDACDVCFEAKKGYFQDGDDMVCRNCNLRFKSIDINVDNQGGCNPGYLANKIDGDQVVITTEALETGLRYFQ